ncbi:MAG: hypothetical protein FWE36_06145 [Erysipelotrichales bacterium]|nr:hypothetical protein [Erysipelotrichales bacterium]
MAADLNYDYQNHVKQKFIVWLACPLIFFAIGSITTPIFIFAILPVWREDADATGRFIILFIMFIVFPWASGLYSVKLFWPTVKINEHGIERKLFGQFFKRKISWEELYEIRVVGLFQGGAWLFFSKKSLAGMSHGKARRQKEQIQIGFTAQLLGTIRFYSDKEIIGVPEDKVIELISKIKNYNLIKNRTLNMEASKEVVPEELDKEGEIK